MATDNDLPALLARVALRDRAAFERLYGLTCAHLLSVAFRILNNRDRAEEVLQEAYMNVWNNAGSYSPAIATPMTWLINIVRNKAIDLVRSRKTELASTQAIDDEALGLPEDDSLQPQRLLDRSLTKARIDACMAGLSAPQRQALALAYYRGMVHTDIAAVMSAPLGTAKAWIRRGLDQLRSCLQAAGVQP
ncbi:MAG: sigma-70 family RNA polymerase sigma factor [Caldimonas sp.]